MAKWRVAMTPWIDRAASLFAGLALAAAIIVIFAPWIMEILR